MGSILKECEWSGISYSWLGVCYIGIKKAASGHYLITFRALLRKQWDKQQIREFLQIMDWMTSLPPELSSRLDEMVETLGSEQNMEYIDSITRLRMARGEAAAHQKGMASVLATLLKSRFQSLPDWVAGKLNQASTDDIERWAQRVLTAPNLEAVFVSEQN